MLIDEQYRKNATYLCVDRLNPDTGVKDRTPVATAFFIYVKENDNDVPIGYAITAQHVIHESRLDGQLYLRVNLKSGGYQDIETPQDSWFTHDRSDVAAMSIDPPSDGDIIALPISHLATDDFLQRHKVGIGDEVFFVGLFSRLRSQKRAIPIIRFGNISMMPDEPVPIKIDAFSRAVEIDAYLVEARSWGGHSGAPAFIHFPPDRHPGVITMAEWPLKEPLFHLLGLVHGHFDIPTNIDFTGDLTGYGSGKVPINAGIGIIVPSQHITELLMREDLVNERENIKKASTS